MVQPEAVFTQPSLVDIAGMSAAFYRQWSGPRRAQEYSTGYSLGDKAQGKKSPTDWRGWGFSLIHAPGAE